MATYPLIDQKTYSHQSAEVNVDGVRFLVKEAKYNDSLEPGELRGNNSMLLARTKGEYKCEASIQMAQQDHAELIQHLGEGFLEKSFDVVISYQEEGMPLIVNTIRGCRIKKNDGGSSAGSDANMVGIDLHPFYILWNGIGPLSNMLRGLDHDD
jgi:hypothetical protein